MPSPSSDQGSQFTGAAFTSALADKGIAISMDGKGAWRDNVFVERLWRAIKYEEVYLPAYESVADARQSIGRYLDFYNTRRPHQSLDGIAPDQAYFKQFCSEIRSQRSLTRVCSRRAKERATAKGTFSTRTAEERSR